MKDNIFCKSYTFLKMEAEFVSETLHVYSVLTRPFCTAYFSTLKQGEKFQSHLTAILNQYIKHFYTEDVLDITRVLMCTNIRHVSEIFTDVLNIR
jgi:hypothetical protein